MNHRFPLSWLVIGFAATTLLFAVHPSQAIVLDFNNGATDFSGNFTRQNAANSNATVTWLTNQVQQNNTASSTLNTVFMYTPAGTAEAFSISDSPLVVSMDIKASAPSGSLGTSFGLYFSDSTNITNNLLVLFNLNNGATADTFRVFGDGSLTGSPGGTTGTQIGLTQNYTAGLDSGTFGTITFSLTSSAVSVTVGGETLTQSLTGADLDWTSTNISFRAVDGANNSANVLAMDNFTITAVPEPPAEAALAASGVFLLFGRLRKKSRTRFGR